jgi:hypothetical protein
MFLDEHVPAVMPDKRIDPNWADFKRDEIRLWNGFFPFLVPGN